MKFLLISIFAVVICAFLFVGYSFFGGRCLPHKLIAQKIPKYENASDWWIHAGGTDMGGGGPCVAEIYFHTNDSESLVFSSYKDDLQGEGWVVTMENKLADVQGNIVGSFLGLKKNNYTLALSSRSHDPKWNFAFSIHKVD